MKPGCARLRPCAFIFCFWHKWRDRMAPYKDAYVTAAQGKFYSSIYALYQKAAESNNDAKLTIQRLKIDGLDVFLASGWTDANKNARVIFSKEKAMDASLADFGRAVGKAGKLAVEIAAGRLLLSVIESQPARGLPQREMESGKIARVDVKKRLATLGGMLGLEVNVGKQSRLDAKDGALYLSPEAALAAAVFVRALGKDAVGKEMLVAALDLKDVPKNASAEGIASALLFLHICEKGIDGALEDLFLGSCVLDWLAANGRAAQANDARHALYAAQLKFAQALL